MPAIKVRENEPFDIALRRFRRLCDRAGVITDVRKKEFFEKPTWVNKRKKAAKRTVPIRVYCVIVLLPRSPSFLSCSNLGTTDVIRFMMIEEEI